MKTLILASTSPFRRRQLQTLGLDFTAVAPDFDETPLPDESESDTAMRLAQGKAQSVAARYPDSLIIGADQVAFCRGRQLGKPMSIAAAQQMLLFLSGQRVSFYSAVCLLDAASGSLKSHCDHTVVHMRTLDEAGIARYLAREPDAVYCAGAAKSEGLGATLIERIDSTDPHALIGLPLLTLIGYLKQAGWVLP